MKHFLALTDFTADEIGALLDRAEALKRNNERTLEGKTLAMLFDKASTRTRVSFEVGMFHLGGHAVMLSFRDSQAGRGEPVEDTARVMSRYVDAIMIRTFDQKVIEKLAAHATVPVINGLTDAFHPCQLLADLMTVRERRGRIEDQVVAWIGDGNNMARSWVNASRLFGFELRLACPGGYRVADPFLRTAKNARAVEAPAEATLGATVVVTDVWASMGQEEEATVRREAFEGYRVDEALLQNAAEDPLVLHCLPAHRGEEITAEVLDGPHSAAFDAAENRLHAQKALLEKLILGQ